MPKYDLREFHRWNFMVKRSIFDYDTRQAELQAREDRTRGTTRRRS
jgi:hypothetical protein